MIDLVIGQIPEAVFFSLFIIYAKGIKEKRIIFTILMVIEYVFLKYIAHLNYNIWFQILYTFMSYLILKILYKEKAQIVDIFVFMESLFILLILTVPFLALNNFINNIYICCLLSKISMFVFLFIIRKKIFKINQKYYKLWNRNNAERRKIKSLTLRNISIVAFNILFYITNILIINIK